MRFHHSRVIEFWRIGQLWQTLYRDTLPYMCSFSFGKRGDKTGIPGGQGKLLRPHLTGWQTSWLKAYLPTVEARAAQFCVNFSLYGQGTYCCYVTKCSTCLANRKTGAPTIVGGKLVFWYSFGRFFTREHKTT